MAYAKRYQKTFSKGKRKFTKYFKSIKARTNATWAMKKRGWK